MCQKGCQVFKQFYAVMLTSAQMKAPKVLRVYKMPPREDVVRQLVTDHVIGKMEPSPHMYGDRPEVHLVPVQIPVDILYG